MNVNETLLPPSYLSPKYFGYVTSQQAKARVVAFLLMAELARNVPVV